MNISSRLTSRSRRRLPFLALALAALLGLAATGLATAATSPLSIARADLAGLSARDASMPTASAAAAKKKKAAPKSKLCVVRIQLAGGGTKNAMQAMWVYRYVRKHGKRVRVMRHILVPVVAGCHPPKCVKQRAVAGRTQLVTVKVKALVPAPKKGRLVLVRKKVTHYVLTTCTTKTPAKPVTTPTTTPGSPQSLGTPVTITVKPDSTANLNFMAFQRQAPLSGVLHGYMLGSAAPGGGNQIILTDGTLLLSPTPVFIDNACNGQVSAAIQTGYPTTVTLDPTQQSTSTLASSGDITSVVYTVIHLPLLLRNGDAGCNSPYMSTGYDSEKATFFLTGKLTGLTGVKLTSAPQDITFGACLAIGSPTSPCTGFTIPIDVLVGTSLDIDIKLG